MNIAIYKYASLAFDFYLIRNTRLYFNTISICIKFENFLQILIIFNCFMFIKSLSISARIEEAIIFTIL